MWNQVSQALADSTALILTNAVSLLPRVVALLVALAASGLIAWILGFIIRRALKGVDLDGRAVRWGWGEVARWFPGRSPTLLLSRLVTWVVLLFGLLVGIAAFDPGLTSELMLRMFAYIPNVAVALLLLMVGNILAHFLARGALIGAVNMNLQHPRIIGFGVKWLILLLTTAMALNHLSIGGHIVDLAFGILFGGIVLAAALAVGLGASGFVSRQLDRSTRPAEQPPEPFSHI